MKYELYILSQCGQHLGQIISESFKGFKGVRHQHKAVVWIFLNY